MSDALEVVKQAVRRIHNPRPVSEVAVSDEAEHVMWVFQQRGWKLTEAAEETPAYVHTLLDGVFRHASVMSLASDPEVPEDVRDRITDYLANIEPPEDATFQATNDTIPLIGAVTAAVQREFAVMLGIELNPNDDATWLRVGTAILRNAGVHHVGWFAPLTERAWLFVADAEKPDRDDVSWTPLYGIAAG
jgi:hypothetical protein